MRAIVFLLPLLSGCLWVSYNELREQWDQDDDGWNLEQDCDDENADVYPFAPDWRGDGCDADCGREADADGDDWPDDADCAPNDITAYPCSTEESSDEDVDCDGLPGISRPAGDCDAAHADPGFPAERSVQLPEGC